MTDPETTLLLRLYFLRGGSAPPVVQQLIDDGDLDHATVVARLALRRTSESSEREQLFQLLNQLASAPSGWSAAIETFARTPSEKAWDDLMAFVPEDVFYDRLKSTVLFLLDLECDGDILFRCVSRMGMITELYDLAESGRVDPDTIAERAAGSPAEAAWLGMAAMAAFARNDRTATTRHLWRAHNLDPMFAFTAISQIRDRSDEAMNAELDEAGIPREFEAARR